MSSLTNNTCILDGVCSSATNIPEFVDTAACLCGLLTSVESNPNGNLQEKWRCIGNASDDIQHGVNGKWFNTTLGSEELSGINEPQNWGDNPPDTSQAFVVQDVGGKPTYVVLHGNSGNGLSGTDGDCTGKNDTQLSGIFYEHSKNSSSSASASASSSSASATSSHSASGSSASSITSGAMSSSSAAGTSPASSATTGTASRTAASTTSPSASPSGVAAPAYQAASLKNVALLGMLLAPLIAFAA